MAMRIAKLLPLLPLVFACAQTAPAPKTAPAAPTTAPPPAARTTDFRENRFGTQLSDPYRWMEGNDNAEVTSWLHAQGDYNQAWLARLPARDALFHAIRELGLGTSSSGGLQSAGGRLFYSHINAGEQLPKLMVRGGRDRVLVDPSLLGTSGSPGSGNAFAPSPDGAP